MEYVGLGVFLLKQTYTVCCWSGGKDSSATIILDYLTERQIDEIIFCEVMYDASRNISGENPLLLDFVYEKAIPQFEKWGYKVTVLRSAKHDYLTYFNHIVKGAKNPEHNGRKAGYPLIGGACAIKRDCKERVTNEYLRSLKREYEVIEILGICANEQKRLDAMYKKKNHYSLLAQHGIMKEQTKGICEGYGLLSESYSLSQRGGCFFCPWAQRDELLYLKEHNPSLWEEFASLEHAEGLVSCKWNPFKGTLSEFLSE